jgi:hypothetical protein
LQRLFKLEDETAAAAFPEAQCIFLKPPALQEIDPIPGSIFCAGFLFHGGAFDYPYRLIEDGKFKSHLL